jgi:DnaJ-class molecular chaperone
VSSVAAMDLLQYFLVFLLSLQLVSYANCSNESDRLYKVLQVPRNASKSEIREAYRKLALKFHPDKNKEKDAAQMFADLQGAYQVLANDEKRKLYDKCGEGRLFHA